MTMPQMILTFLAVGSFALALLRRDSDRGMPAGMIFLTLLLVVSIGDRL